jgi:cell division protein FtsN
LAHLIVMGLAVGDRARAFKGLSPGMLPPLGIIFGLLVGFIAAQVWSDFEKAKVAVANEASALRTVNLLAANLPAEPRGQIRPLVTQHIDNAVNQEWPAMATQRETLSELPTALIEATQTALAVSPADEGQRTAQREVVDALEQAMEVRRQRIVISQSTLTTVNSDNQLTCRIALALFATGIALSVLLIAASSHTFTSEISVGPELLKQVIAGCE